MEQACISKTVKQPIKSARLYTTWDDLSPKLSKLLSSPVSHSNFRVVKRINLFALYKTDCFFR